MSTRKKILNHLLDIGGVATLNNFFNPTSKTYKGSLLRTRINFKALLEADLIRKLDPILKVQNPANEVFYALTRKGADHIGRADEYKHRDAKSPNINNIFHESALRDVCLSFIRLYPNYIVSITTDTSYNGIRPDAVIKLTTKDQSKTYTYLVEIERKKDTSRVHDKIQRYEELLTKNNCRKYGLQPYQYGVLIVYANLTYNVFSRPQHYIDTVLADVHNVKRLTEILAVDVGTTSLQNIYRFMAFPDFYQLNQPVWRKPGGQLTELVQQHPTLV